METKKLKKQLIAAIAMVMVAALALGSSTYAWFANNTKVTAEGMSIKALSEGANLEIAWTDTEAAWTANAGKTLISDTIGNTGFVAANYQNKALYPTHYVVAGETNFVGKTEKGGNTLAAGNWVHTFSDKYDAKASTGDYTYTSTVLEKVAALNPSSPATTDYTLVVPIYLRMNPNSSNGINNLKATATISSTNTSDQKMLSAARVLYVVDSVVVGTGATTGTTVTGLGAVAAPISGASEVKTVYAVIYIDGEDTNCTSANYNTEDWTVSIAFEGDIAS